MNKRNITFTSATACNIKPVSTIAPVTTIYPAEVSTPAPEIPTSQEPLTVESYDYLTAIQIKDFLGVSRSKAYDIIHELNQELEKMGKLTISGKIPRKLLLDKLYPQSLTA